MKTRVLLTIEELIDVDCKPIQVSNKFTCKEDIIKSVLSFAEFIKQDETLSNVLMSCLEHDGEFKSIKLPDDTPDQVVRSVLKGLMDED